MWHRLRHFIQRAYYRLGETADASTIFDSAALIGADGTICVDSQDGHLCVVH